MTVIDNETQVDFRNMHGRGVVLDCVAKDGSGRIFNVEIQQDDEGAHPKRYQIQPRDDGFQRAGYGKELR